jgi:hypothetical protein
VCSGPGFAVAIQSGVTGTLIQNTTISGSGTGCITGSSDLQTAVYNETGTTAGVTEKGVYMYDAERILEGLGTIENSFCYENIGTSGSHHECDHDTPGSGGLAVSNTVMLNPYTETANFDQENGSGSGIDATNDIFIGGGSYNVYPGGAGACANSTFSTNRFSRFYYATGGQYGVDHDPGCASVTWSGNIWDNTGVTVSQTG